MKHTNLPHSDGVRALTVLSVSLLVALGAPAFGQAPQYPQQYPAQAPPAGVQQPVTQPLMPPAQLDNLVAPIALYPDPLLGQALAASTYPLEVVEANQFVQQNGNLHGLDLMNAARQQNWDPSVQALVAFPNALTLLTSNVRWTTDLGNAFLAQQQDLMAAVQRMRVRAQSNGRLSSNPQQTVSNETQNGQSAVEIEPANPDYIDVRDYNPDYVWGPPAEGYYPPLWYPPVQYGFGFDPGIYLGGFFPGWGFGWGGWGTGWGWGCGWFGGGLFVNVGFFNHWGFHGYFGSRFAGGFGAGRSGWEHDPFHRSGVPYANRNVAARFSSSARFAEGRTARTNTVNGARGGVTGSAAPAGAHGFAGSGLAMNRGGSAGEGGWQHFGGNAPAVPRGYATPNGGAQSFRGNGGAGFNSAPRSFATPGYAAPRSYGGNSRAYSGSGFSAPRSSGGGGFSGGGARPSSGGGFSGGHSSGGGGGAHSSGGGSHGGGHR